jgi:type VI secretion system protein ImpA
MSELIEKLLLPVSPEQPSGPDLSYDPRLEELESLLKGKPEIDIGSVKRPAEPPEWRELTEKSAKFLEQCKHLRAAVIFCCGLLKTRGVSGFSNGMRLVRGLVEQNWPTVYPSLDVEENNDPTQRLNTLGALAAPRGSVGGWLTILDYLYTAPLCQPKGSPPISYEQIEIAKKKEAGADAASALGPDPKKLAEAIRGPGAEEIRGSVASLNTALEAIQAVDLFLTTTLGADNTISFEVLEKTLQKMIADVQSYLPGTSGETSISQPTATEQARTDQVDGILVSGSIRSRDQVVRAIDSICEYYRQVEPCSPVPFLLRRAQKLAVMDFVQALQELNLATVEALRPSMGSAVEPATPTETGS